MKRSVFLTAVRFAIFAFAANLTFENAKATVFDWDQGYATWTAGAPAVGATASQSYNSDTTNAGNDVTVAITNNAGNPSSGGGRFTWNGGYPQVSTNPLTGGNTPTQRALQLSISQGNSAGVSVTVTFNYPAGVRNVSFSLWDIDNTPGQWIDQISNITAQTTSGTTIGPTSVVGSTANVVTGSGTGYVITGTASGNNAATDGNATITFGSGAITSITFTWKNTDAALGQQFIALHDLTYTPVPEVGTGMTALGVCGGVIGLHFYRRRRAAVS